MGSEEVFQFWGERGEPHRIVEGKEMTRRKIKSRKEKEVLEKKRVEVVQKPLELPMLSSKKLRLDKEELMRNIARAK